MLAVDCTEVRLDDDDLYILTRPYVEHRSTEYLARRTGATIVTLPLEVGGAAEAVDFIGLFDHVIGQVHTALTAIEAEGEAKGGG